MWHVAGSGSTLSIVAAIVVVSLVILIIVIVTIYKRKQKKKLADEENAYAAKIARSSGNSDTSQLARMNLTPQPYYGQLHSPLPTTPRDHSLPTISRDHSVPPTPRGDHPSSYWQEEGASLLSPGGRGTRFQEGEGAREGGVSMPERAAVRQQLSDIEDGVIRNERMQGVGSNR
ncbi:hypothetical protein B0H66DRAFT_535111 [Apodospora peruviana]|uniref:Uncharacterized protein n=1 Tax=Apodospora peruviana TaxID=516989 RepID=A0AAE0I3D8_9PEZI|nr:hypothetical protein B0H66DRAFT_535111 [Apodospora peruviana]